MSRIQSSAFLRCALGADALASSATGAIALIGAPFLAPLLGLPEDLLRGAGLTLIPFVAFIVWLAARAQLSRGLVWLAVGLNIVWVADSFILLAGDWVSPTPLGYGFVIAQALAVAGFAVLEWMGLKRSAAIA